MQAIAEVCRSLGENRKHRACPKEQWEGQEDRISCSSGCFQEHGVDTAAALQITLGTFAPACAGSAALAGLQPEAPSSCLRLQPLPPLALLLFCPGTTRPQKVCGEFRSHRPRVLCLVIKWETERIQLWVKSLRCSACWLYAADGAVTVGGIACQQEPAQTRASESSVLSRGVSRSQRLLLPCSG